MFKKYCKIINIFIMLIILSSCNQNKAPYKETAFLMGTIIDITTYDKALPKLNKKAFERIKEIENKMTINSEVESEIEQLNKLSGIKEVKLSDDTFFVLEKGKSYSEASNGRFDITVGSLVKLWNIGTDKAKKPAQALIDQKLNLVNYNDLELDSINKTAKLLKSGMIVDLGAIAKGYAADEVKKILTLGGIKSAIINVGGNIMTVGSKPNGEPWSVGVQNPFSNRGDYLGILKLEDKSIVSSGDYERYFEDDGIKYHHILDPETGYPCDNEITGVSIISQASIDADALSTTSFLLGISKGLEFINSIDGTEAIFITKDRNIYFTKGICKTSFELKDNSFKLNFAN